MAPSDVVGSELLTAVHLLSKLVGPYAKALLFLSFLYNPLRILPNVGSILASTTPAPVLISGALLLESLVRPKYAGEDNLSDVLSNPLQVLQDVHKRVGVHFKIALFLYYFVYHLPRYTHQEVFPLVLSTPSLALAAAAIATGAALTALVTLTPTLYGPARFCYIELPTHVAQLYQILLDWWIYAATLVALVPSLAPVAALAGSCAAMAAIVLVCRAYTANCHAVADEVAEQVAVANLAVAAAREQAAAARGYEQRLLDAVLLPGAGAGTASGTVRRNLSVAAAAAGRLLGREDKLGATGSSTSDAVFVTAKGADKVERLAARAIEAANKGEVIEARELSAAAKTEADAVVVSMETVRRSTVDAQKALLVWLEGQA